MAPLPLVPTPDTIPAPAWLFQILDVLFFLIHIILINTILGGGLLLLASRFRRWEGRPPGSEGLSEKLPVLFPIGITMGVAPLLFMQVIYGHLFYTSSVLMGAFWIVVIPVVIVAYYGIYVQAKSSREGLVTASLMVTVLCLLYVGFAFTNNLLLMIQPEKWPSYFTNRGGTILDTADATFIPRYLHFVVASVAVASLVSALIWSYRKNHGAGEATDRIAGGLKLFGITSIVQIAVGLWFLLSLKREFMLQFMGENIVATIIFMLGFLCGIGATATAFSAKLRPTVIQTGITLILMVLTRDHLRMIYLHGVFDTESLLLTPQYGVLALFIVVLIAGVASVAWMLKASFSNPSRRAAQ
jgi:hypothetical protein